MDELFEGRAMGPSAEYSSHQTRLVLQVPPERVQDLQKIFTLESLGFLPSGSMQYSAAEQLFILELSGKAVSHLLELLEIAIDDRKAETWSERVARDGDQLALFI